MRPIVRGKAGRKTEYGAEIGVSVVNDFTYIDHLSWDAYNEGAELMLQIMTYKERFGYYPQEDPDPEEEKLRRKASGERNEVEATFGTAKRVYRANNIRAS